MFMKKECLLSEIIKMLAAIALSTKGRGNEMQTLAKVTQPVRDGGETESRPDS